MWRRAPGACWMAETLPAPPIWLALAGGGVVLLAGIWLPYHWSPGGLRENTSLAVAAGFDHRAAVLGIVAGLGLAGLAQALLPAREAPAAPVTPGLTLPRAFWGMAAATALLLLFQRFNGGPAFFEMGYYIFRMELMAQGAQPYRDFLFNYGPLLIFPAHWAHLLLPGDPYPAFILALTATQAANLLLLRALVAALPLPPPRQGLAFLALAVFWLPLTYGSGMHYAGPRFVLPVLLAFLLARQLRGAGLPRLVLLPLLAALACFLLGIEVGLVMLVFGLGALGFFALAERRAMPALALALLATIWAGLWFALPEWLVAPIVNNLDGREFPLVPSVFVVFYLATMLVAAAAGLAPLLRAVVTGRLPETPAIGLCFVAVLAVMQVPGAVGRADFGHLQAFGLGGVVVCLALAAHGRGFWPGYPALTIALCLLYQLVSLSLVTRSLPSGDLARAVIVQIHAVAPDLVRRGCDWAGRDCSSPEKLDGSAERAAEAARRAAWQSIAARFPGAYDPFAAASPTPGIATGYFVGTADVFSPYAIARKLAELRAAPIYLLPADILALRDASSSGGLAMDPAIYRRLSLYPLDIPLQRHTSATALVALFDEAIADCRPLAEIAGIRVCGRP